MVLAASDRVLVACYGFVRRAHHGLGVDFVPSLAPLSNARARRVGDKGGGTYRTNMDPLRSLGGLTVGGKCHSVPRGGREEGFLRGNKLGARGRVLTASVRRGRGGQGARAAKELEDRRRG
jgi:hypothetical protein